MILVLYVYELSSLVCMSVHQSLDPLELEFQTVVSLHVGVGYRTCVFWESSLCLMFGTSLLFLISSFKRRKKNAFQRSVLYSLVFFKEHKYFQNQNTNISI